MLRLGRFAFNSPGLLVASSGIDSTVMAYALAYAGLLEGLVFFDYGQATAELQHENLLHHAKRLRCDYSRERVVWPSYARGKGYIFREGSAPDHPDNDTLRKLGYEDYLEYLEETWDFLQGRNTVFMALACARAISQGLEVVYTGFQEEEERWLMPPANLLRTDTGQSFLEGFNYLAASGAYTRPIRLVAPFLDARYGKADIVALGEELGVEWDKTHSCEFLPACGKCFQCTIRARTLNKSG